MTSGMEWDGTSHAEFRQPQIYLVHDLDLENFRQDEEHVSVTLPSEFVSNHPIKALTHGFSSRVISDEKTLFVDGDKDILIVYTILTS